MNRNMKRVSLKDTLFFKLGNIADRLLLWIVLLTLIIFVIYPMICIAVKSIYIDGNLSFVVYQEIFDKYKRIFANTIFVAVCTAILSTIWSVATAMFVSVQTGWKKLLSMGILLITMVSPPFLSSLSYIQLYGRRGLITHQLLNLSLDPYNCWGIILMQSLSFVPLNAIFLIGLLEKIDNGCMKASRDLGASAMATLHRIVLPLIRPGILVSLLLSFIRSAADFGTPVVIGGRFQTVASTIYMQIIGYSDLNKASALNVLLLIPALVIFMLYRNLLKKADALLNTGRDVKTGIQMKLHQCGLTGILFLFLSALFYIMIILQYYSIISTGFTKYIRGKGYFTLEYVQEFLAYDLTPLMRSIVYALIVAVFGTLFAILLSYYLERRNVFAKRFFSFSAMLPYMIPGTCFGIGYIFAFNKEPIAITGTALIVILNMWFKQLPNTFQVCNASLTQIPISMENAAKDLGAGKFYVLKDVIVPNLKQAFYSGFVYNFTSSMTTAGAIIFLISPSQKIAVFRLFDAITTGKYGIAAVIATAIILVSLFVNLIAYILIGRKEKHHVPTGEAFTKKLRG